VTYYEFLATLLISLSYYDHKSPGYPWILGLMYRLELTPGSYEKENCY
jgi:hypothetical protein